MSTKSFEKGMTWGGIAIATVAALGFAMVQSQAAVADEAAPQKQTKIQLAIDRDGALERVNLIDLHAMAVGETRTLETESGRPVTVTRDESGFDVDIDGKTVRVQDHFGELTEGDSNVVFKKRVMVESDGDGANTMVFHSSDEPGDVVIMKRHGGEGDAHGFAWATDGAELPPIAFGVDGTIARLEKNAKFKELDAATRATVLEALRESAGEVKIVRKVSGGPGQRVMVIETEDEERAE